MAGNEEMDKKETSSQVEQRKPSSESEKFLRRSKLDCEEREVQECKLVLQEIASSDVGIGRIFRKKGEKKNFPNFVHLAIVFICND